jgi:hypothetical protein
MANIFAVRDSSLNAFLFSDVGVESNGTGLTILSLLARLGKDPWAEAAAWSLKSKDTAITSLTDCIAQMPPNQQAFDDAHLTASRLVALLPTRLALQGAVAKPAGLPTIPKTNWMIFVYLLLFLVFNLMLTMAPKPHASATSAVHPVAASTR